MRKGILITLLLAGVAGAGFWFLRPTAPPDPESSYYAAYLPADTWAVLKLFDLHGLSKVFPESAAGKFLAKETVRGMLTELNADQEAVSRYEEVYDGAADLFSSPILQHLFGDDATVALLAPDPVRLQHDPDAERRRMLLVFGTSATASSVARLARLTLSEVSTEQTATGLTLTRIRLDEDESLYGTVRAGVIILAYSPETVELAIQQQEQGRGLDSNPQFAAAQKFWAEEKLGSRFFATFYTNIDKLRANLTASGQPEAQQAAARLRGMTSLSATAAERQGELRFRSRTSIKPDLLDKTVQQERERQQGQRNLALHLLQEQSLVYLWFSSLEAGLFAAADPVSVDKKAQLLFGLPFVEVMAALGPQAALSLGELASTGLFPVPTVSLAVEARHAEQTERLLVALRQRLSSELGQLASEQTSEGGGGQPLYYWKLLPAEAAHPALTLSSRLLSFANGESRLRTLLTQEQQGLPQAMRQSLGPNLAAEFSTATSAAFVLRPARLAAAIQQAEVWLQSSFPALRGKLRAELTRLVQPLELAVGWSRVEHDHTLSVLVLREKAVQ